MGFLSLKQTGDIVHCWLSHHRQMRSSVSTWTTFSDGDVKIEEGRLTKHSWFPGSYLHHLLIEFLTTFLPSLSQKYHNEKGLTNILFYLSWEMVKRKKGFFKREWPSNPCFYYKTVIYSHIKGLSRQRTRNKNTKNRFAKAVSSFFSSLYSGGINKGYFVLPFVHIIDFERKSIKLWGRVCTPRKNERKKKKSCKRNKKKNFTIANHPMISNTITFDFDWSDKK